MRHREWHWEQVPALDQSPGEQTEQVPSGLQSRQVGGHLEQTSFAASSTKPSAQSSATTNSSRALLNFLERMSVLMALDPLRLNYWLRKLATISISPKEIGF